LAFNISKGRPDGETKPILTVESVLVGLVDELDHVVGAAHDDDVARRLIQNAPQLFYLSLASVVRIRHIRYALHPGENFE
jgi:hypothetical protein